MSAISAITPNKVVPARPLPLPAPGRAADPNLNNDRLADLGGLLRAGGQGKRVALELALVQVEIDRRADGTSSGAAATGYRDIAVAFAQRGAFDQAWIAVKAADRELLETYGPDELRAEAARITREADAKLKGWRAAHIRASLGASARRTNGSVVSARTVIECRRVLDDAADTVYRKLGLLRRRLRWSAVTLIGTMLMVVTAWLAAAGAGVDPVVRSGLLDHWSSLLVVLTLGTLGAALSGLLSMGDRMTDARVPDLSLGLALLVWRPVVGAASAFAVVLILQSGVAGLALDSSAALVAALIAGTTEQVVTHAIGRAGALIKQGTAGPATAPNPPADRETR
jgi:hypothetical protein